MNQQKSNVKKNVKKSDVKRKEIVAVDITDKITPEQWERLNAVANEAISCGYFIEDGKTEKVLIENEAVERFVQFLENYYVS